KILLSNDDGILAPGLAALHAAVADMGDVAVVAPDSPQSAAGHAITLTHPLTVRRVAVAGPGGFAGMSVDGRPADCVRLAIRSLLDGRPDVVLAGINAGSNVGINVFYSGTVAAAAEAAMFGIPAVAFSADMSGEVDFAAIARQCRMVLDRLLARGLAPGELVNVNIPPLTGGLAKGVRVVRQSTAGLEDTYHRNVDVDGLESFRIGDEYAFAPTEDDTDVITFSQGYITVTPLHIDRTDHAQLESLRQCQWPAEETRHE
ncbi:MAG: 5'/3'-nucleotidase SurE, partial [Planctomycetaceae bacterium]